MVGFEFNQVKVFMQKEYSSSQIKVLKGLDPVKKVPGMYTRTTSPNHIVYEVIDNAQDEALGGYANKLLVKVIDDNTVLIEDNGRGIPVDFMEEEGKSAVEVIFTSLHSGGKFDKEEGGAYDFSGGLHGVGVSVTNALSKSVKVRINKNGKSYAIDFADGYVVSDLKETGKVDKSRNKTSVEVVPDLTYFDNPLNIDELKNYIRVKSALLNGVEIVFQYKEDEPISWNYSTLKDYLLTESNKINEETYWKTEGDESVANVDSNLWNFKYYLPETNTIGSKGEGLDVVIGFLEEGKRIQESFVNLISTLDGGTHVRGLKSGLFEGLKSYMNNYNLMPAKITLDSEDLWSRTSFVISAKLLKPKFASQTKEKLSSETSAKLVSGLIKDNFELWLDENPIFAKKLSEMVIDNANRRNKAEIKTDRKKSNGNAVLPGKLTDCVDTNPERTELFICEGDSAGGGAKQARDKEFQAIYPIRGKILNTWEVERSKLFESETIENIAIVIGIEPHGVRDNIDMSKLRYGKICTMCDADVDGRHIEVLLMTLFLRHFPQIVTNGHLYIARAPLYRVDYPSSKKSKNKLDKKEYIQNEEDLDKLLKKLFLQDLTLLKL